MSVTVCVVCLLFFRAAVDWVEKPLWTTVANFPAPSLGPKQGPYDAFANPPRPQVRVGARSAAHQSPAAGRALSSQQLDAKLGRRCCQGERGWTCFACLACPHLW